MPNRLRISLKRTPAMQVNRISINNLKLVYIVCANRKIKYQSGSSPVVYIGTTRNGISRVAASAAYRAEEILTRHGVDALEIRIVTCQPRQRVRTWHKLERAFLIAFKNKYGKVPLCNITGKNFVETDEFDYFARKRINDILADLEESGAARQSAVTG